ncbi:hypothetical protein LH53_06090 [Mesotoga sp. TolDC]|nr:hypothetical protein LH53_06090 [Mesotoga sp. TolDC]
MASLVVLLTIFHGGSKISSFPEVQYQQIAVLRSTTRKLPGRQTDQAKAVPGSQKNGIFVDS